MARCEGGCDASPRNSMLAEASNSYQPSNDRIRGKTDDVNTTTGLVNALDSNVENTGPLVSLENSRELDKINAVPFRYDFEDTEFLNYNQTATISTQTPTSTYV